MPDLASPGRSPVPSATATARAATVSTPGLTSWPRPAARGRRRARPRDFAGYAAGGWGNLVVVLHDSGVRTLYAHLSKVSVRRGALVATGTRVGLVGATGDATGPHLHFEVRLRGAAVDPLSALP